MLIALAVVLLGLGAVTARTAAGALATTLRLPARRLRRRAGGVPRGPRPGVEKSRSPLADTIISSTFDTAQRPLAIIVGGACLVGNGLVAVVAGLRWDRVRPV